VPVRTDGFSVAASKRASDLDMKLELLRQAGGKVAALFTGTPVSNSLLEMYVLQHYLHPERLDQIGLGSADAWAATFVEFQTTVEVTPEGGRFRLKRRPVKFENVPELLTLFGEVADLRPPGSFAVTRPDARHHNVVISSSAELRGYVAELASRADRLHLVDAHDDNILKICSDGRKAALDLGLVGVTTNRPGKVGAVVANVARIYHDTAASGGFQIVFCDLGTPNPGSTQVYGKIRSGLIAAGVPADRIRFIHHATTDSAKAALFADCRAGNVAVLLGSTDKLGVGTNIQTRCVALHHVDAPWRPADVEQREGRALRPGNLNPAVDLYRYVTEKSFDSFMWQALERKARFIGQVLSGRPAGRDVDDIGDATLSFAELKALATGNPLLLELAEANADVTRLRQLATAHTRATKRLTHSVDAWQQRITSRTQLAGDCDRIAATHREHPDPAWYDQRKRPIPEDHVPGHLAYLAAQAMEPDARLQPATWRGLRISFSKTGIWREASPAATITAGTASLTVGLSPVWVSKGQHWRIEKEIRAAIDDAEVTARQARAEIADLRKRIADANTRIGEPFAHTAELEAARARRDSIEAAIRDAATPTAGQDPETETDRGCGGADEVYRIDSLDADDGEERVTITSVLAPHRADLDGDLSAGSPPAGPETSTSGLAKKPPQSVHPMKYPTEPDGEPDSSLRMPAAASGSRASVRAASLDATVQGTLFDFPPTAAAPARRGSAGRSRARRPRR
jgi:hypothetical protein